MKSIVRLEDLDPADFIIKWRMTEICNLKCSYCIRGWRGNREFDKEILSAQEKRLCEIAEKLSSILDKTRFNNIKIDLIGGEVTLLDLKEILSHLATKKITKIQVTTNFMKDADYYASLAFYLKERGITLSMTASFHYEFQSFEKYFEKVCEVKDKVGIFTAEIVSNEKNQPLCRKFQAKCKELGINYMIEADLRNSSKTAREKGLLVDSNKPSKIPRYKAIFTDNTQKFYTTRNQFLTDKNIIENSDLKYMKTKGYYCTNTSDFFYLDFDMAVGRTEQSDSCTNRMPIEDFNVLPPRKCPHNKCSLCGHMSLWR